MAVDLGDFKPRNDRLGHAAGDQVLAEAARRMVSTVRAVDTVPRSNGGGSLWSCWTRFAMELMTRA
ncbi:diguanylate cyclase [Kinneretia aquatilis]|uniref:diguanylate cyclase n=1 Tax=Kinneretia aquatilis TaxID=2070761 RepID=UPI0014952A43